MVAFPGIDTGRVAIRCNNGVTRIDACSGRLVTAPGAVGDNPASIESSHGGGRLQGGMDCHPELAYPAMAAALVGESAGVMPMWAGRLGFREAAHEKRTKTRCA